MREAIKLASISSSLDQLNFLMQNALNDVIYTSSSYFECQGVNDLAPCGIWTTRGVAHVTSWTTWTTITSFEDH